MEELEKMLVNLNNQFLKGQREYKYYVQENEKIIEDLMGQTEELDSRLSKVTEVLKSVGKDLRARIAGVKCLTFLRQPYSDLIEIDSAAEWLKKQENW